MTSEKRAHKFHTVTNLELGVAPDWLKEISHTEQPNRSTIQIWEVTCHQYGISLLVSQTSIMIYIFYQGHPTTVFCKISVRRSKYYLEFSITWGRLIFKMTVPLTHNFRSLSYKFLTIFWSLIIRISLPRLGYFSSRKGNLKCSDLKIWWREKSGKFSLWFRNALNCL